MAYFQSVRGFTPKYGENCYFSPNATIVGDVVMGNDCSVWFNAVLRGDVNSIRIGNKVNIQDGSVLHCLFEKSKILIGDNVTIGHNAVIHGANIGSNVLIGIGSVVLDNATIGENSIIAAGSVVLENTIIEPGSLYGGTPARFIKKVDPQQISNMIERIANNYIMYASWYKEK